ncbi:hypothetical protein QAD02_017607 [Eretmocerus hayati]|uniref:Uncharacterized protein n=1 Tax=Eretmocerus hayati TaxID=131215 RepID=A0ACC2PEG1_9HYME|nr:hypothetical protein QAD02_017607 [Eretmocerus hayati]
MRKVLFQPNLSRSLSTVSTFPLESDFTVLATQSNRLVNLLECVSFASGTGTYKLNVAVLLHALNAEQRSTALPTNVLKKMPTLSALTVKAIIAQITKSVRNISFNVCSHAGSS